MGALAARLLAGLRRGGSGHCLRHRCDRPSHSDADPTLNAPVWRSGRLNSHRPHTRHDKTVLSVSCLAWQCELGIGKTVSAGQKCHCRDQDSAVSVATVPLESLQQAGEERYWTEFRGSTWVKVLRHGQNFVLLASHDENVLDRANTETRRQ